MPERWLVAHIEMLPRLRAEESLQAAQEAAAGDCWADPKSRREIMDGWRKEATGRREREPERMTKEQFRERMALMGLQFDG